MSEFGYIPEAPEQSAGNNKGIFTPKDIYDLTRADKYTNYGQLELIETQTGTNVASVDFTGIDSTYDSYKLHVTDLKTETDDVEAPNVKVPPLLSVIVLTLILSTSNS